MKLLRWIIQNRVLALKILRLFAENESLTLFFAKSENRKILKHLWKSPVRFQAAESFLTWLWRTKANRVELVHFLKKTYAEELLIALLAKRMNWMLLSQLALNFLRKDFGVNTKSGRLAYFLGTAQPKDLESFVSYIQSNQNLTSEFHSVPRHVGASWHHLTDIRNKEPFATKAKAVVESPDGLLNYDRLYHLYQALQTVSARFQSESLVCVEAGVFRGKTSEFLCHLLAQDTRSRTLFFAIDTFEGHSNLDLPNETEGANRSGLFADTSEAAVHKLLDSFSFATVRKGRIQDVAATLPAETFHFVHLDMDLYAPTLWAMAYFADKMPVGAILIVDDYDKKTCPGIKQAIDEFDSSNPGTFLRWDLQSAQCLLIRL